MNVPIPMPMPRHVTVSWTETGAACIVWCAACSVGVAIYGTVFARDPDALVKAVDEHKGCRP
jgi:hypothetical protein